jgi:hypothetical protein
MGKTAIPPRNEDAFETDTYEVRRASGKWTVKKVLTLLASLRLTVVLFALSFVLVFCGTLAQVDAGIWTVVNKYFRSAYVWIPFQIFIPRSITVSGGFPFPGGWLLGGVLLVNLLAAHLVRFKVSWKRSGILLIHAGLVVMMLSELVTGLFAIEGRMSILENTSSNFIEQHNANELAIIDPSSSATDTVVTIPEHLLRQGGLIHHELLPFDVEVERYLTNSESPHEPGAGETNPATAGDGTKAITHALPEVTGTDAEQKVDMASVYVTFKKRGGESLGSYLVSAWWSDWLELWGKDRPQQVRLGDKAYQVYLRSRRIYKPYSVYLKEFRHDVYVGTDTPKNFSSLAQLVDPKQHEDREVLIYMNQPLRYAGETFYQTGVLPLDRGTILQVVKNPGWLMPYVSCAMVSVGMLIHFGMHLIGFLRLRMAR